MLQHFGCSHCLDIFPSDYNVQGYKKTDIAYSARQWYLFGLIVVHVPIGEQLNGPCSLI